MTRDCEKFIVQTDDADRRLDRVLRKFLRDIPISAIYKNLRNGKIRLNGKKTSGEIRTVCGDEILIERRVIESCRAVEDKMKNFPNEIRIAQEDKTCNAREAEKFRRDLKTKTNIRAANKLEILFSDSNFLIVNKPAGIPVLPNSRESVVANGRADDVSNNHADGLKDAFADDVMNGRARNVTNGRAGLATNNHAGNSIAELVKNLQDNFDFENKSSRSLSFVSAPLHRLDKWTSGILVFSQSLAGARFFSSALQNHRVKKFYIAILCGEIFEKQTWIENLTRDEKSFSRKMKISDDATSKTAKTTVEPLLQANFEGQKISLAKIQIDTGVTHQIRAQSAFHGFPLLGDEKYDGTKLPAKWTRRFFLHACEMRVYENDADKLVFPKIFCPIDGEFLKFCKQVFKTDARQFFNDI